MEGKCTVCENNASYHSKTDGNKYCRKHYLQMLRHGKISKRTIYDKNSYIEKEGYFILLSYDRFGNINGEILIDKEDFEKVNSYKWHIRKSYKKKYAIATMPDGNRCSNKKVHLHKLLLNTKSIVDHINGNSLDNRKSNLRVVQHQQNMFNIKKKTFTGVKKMSYKKESYQAHIMLNYEDIYIGTFSTYEEACLARLRKEKELFGEYGGHKDLYYIIDHPSPIEELKRVLYEGV